MGTEISYCAPDATADGRVNVEPPKALPVVNANLNPASQAQEPELSTFQVFVKACPGVICVLSGMLTSLTNVRPLQVVAGREEPPELLVGALSGVPPVGVANGSKVGEAVRVGKRV
jgi:hypothetical protein